MQHYLGLVKDALLPLPTSHMSRKRSYSSADCLKPNSVHDDAYLYNTPYLHANTNGKKPRRLASVDECFLLTSETLTLHQNQQNRSFKKRKNQEQHLNSVSDDRWFDQLFGNSDWIWRNLNSEAELTNNNSLNDDILSRICYHLDVESLKNFRLVCKEWKAGASVQFKQRTQVHIDMTSFPFCAYGPRGTFYYWSEYVSRQRGYGQEPLALSKNFRLTTMDIKDYNFLDETLEVLGCKIKSMVIDGVIENVFDEIDENSGKRQLLRISQLCPNLETLEMRDLPDRMVEKGFPTLMKALLINDGGFRNISKFLFHSSRYYCPLDAQFLMDLFDCSEQITTLSFSVGDDDALDEITTALELRPQLMQRVQVLQFPNTFGNTLYETHIQTLVNLEMNLKVLEIGSMGLDVHAETLFYLLEGLADTLEVLKLGELEVCGGPELNWRQGLQDFNRRFYKRKSLM